MRRHSESKAWWHGALQLGVLASVGVLCVGGVEPVAAAQCTDVNCKARAVRVMFAVEYSSAMNQPFDAETTRWEKAVETIESLFDADNGFFFSENSILGLMRFGSDPDPNAPDTANFGDVTGLRDGVKLDIGWYDELGPDKPYFQCEGGDAVVAALAGLPPPVEGIGTWTKGALEFTAAYRAKSDADHPMELGKRGTAVVLVTAGIWTDAEGTQTLGPSDEDPKATAATLAKLGVPTFVVNVGGALGKFIADPLAQAGGTGQVFTADDADAVVSALQAFYAKLLEEQLLPVCRPAFPRVMFVLDASSAMLNVGPVHGQPGEAAWDQVREALAGDASVLDTLLQNNAVVDAIGQYGLVAFGGDAESEQALVVQYGFCAEPRIAWGLDPASSCEAPGCVDPYAAPPIAWTSKNGGMSDPPGFDQDVFSHMPRCDLDPQTPQACTGSGRFTHLGLQKVEENLAAYKAQCLAPGSPDPCDAETPFLNVLITDGPYDSTDAEVQARLVALFEAGVVTRVYGIGDAVDPAQLEAMAGWGSGGAFQASFAADGVALAEVIGGMLTDYLEQLTFDECCSFPECKSTSEETGSSSGESEGDSSTGGSSGTTEGVEATSGASSGTSPSPTTGGTSEVGSTGMSATSSTGADEATGSVPVPTTTSAPPPGGTGSSGTGGEQVGAPDAGCACAAGGAAGPRGLVLCGLVGLLRRRRRA